KKEVTLTILRKNPPPDHAEFQPVKVTLSWDDSWWDTDEQPISERSPVSLSGLGIAYRVETTVSELVPDSPAAKAGILKDDVIKAVRFYQAGAKPDDEPKPDKWSDLKSDQWARVFYVLQHLEVKKVDLRLERDQLEVTLTAQEDPTWPLDDRGFLFT